MIRRPFLYAGIFMFVSLVVLVRADQVLVYEKTGAFGTVLVTDENGLRVLRFERGGARQTVVKLGDPEHLELPYARVALTSLALCDEPRRMLVVGLGGGTLPMFLRKHYPTAEIDAVDIDPEVVYVAKRYFEFREDSRMRVHVGDGREFIERYRQPYDLIFLDAFSSDSVPAHLTTQEFLRAVRRALKPGGVVVGNVWSRASNPLYDSMIRTYQEVFDDLYILEVPGAGNRILLALPRRQTLSRDELAARASRVSTAQQFRFDLGELAAAGFQHAREKNPQGRVLTDADLAPRR
jgi:spermidine synthase